MVGEVWGLACCGDWLLLMLSLVIGRGFLVVDGGGAGDIGFWRLVVWCCARGVVFAGCCLGAVFGVGENWLVRSGVDCGLYPARG